MSAELAPGTWLRSHTGAYARLQSVTRIKLSKKVSVTVHGRFRLLHWSRATGELYQGGTIFTAQELGAMIAKGEIRLLERQPARRTLNAAALA